jgi:hypothetical protein
LLLWLFTVPTLTPSTSAISRSVRSSKPQDQYGPLLGGQLQQGGTQGQAQAHRAGRVVAAGQVGHEAGQALGCVARAPPRGARRGSFGLLDRRDSGAGGPLMSPPMTLHRHAALPPPSTFSPIRVYHPLAGLAPKVALWAGHRTTTVGGWGGYLG